MATFLHNQTRDKWAILAPKRVNRAGGAPLVAAGRREPVCPFCPDANDQILNNTEVYRENGVYVITNKNPLTDIHEVIIFSKDHDCDIDTLPKEQVFNVFKVLRQRCLTHENKGQVIIFQNRGSQAGATVNHSHAQLVVVPREVKIQTLEPQQVANIIFETEHLVAFCPDFSQFSFEVWITEKTNKAGPVPCKDSQAGGASERDPDRRSSDPSASTGGNETCDRTRASEHSFSDLDDSFLEELSGLLQKILQELIKQLSGKDDWEEWVIPILWKEGVHYNWYISPNKPWYLRVIPRLNIFAGLEFSTGLTVNMISPASAAQSLRQ